MTEEAIGYLSIKPKHSKQTCMTIKGKSKNFPNIKISSNVRNTTEN